MPVKVLFFGAVADLAGKRRQEIDVADGELASTVFGRILVENTKLAAHKLHFSVNQQFATGNEVVNNGDELAVFTAVSGG